MTEFAVASDGVKLAFERVGRGPPVVLVHGFGSSRGQNWKATGWYGSLNDAGFAVVAMDCRGHGESGRPHDVAAYGLDRMSQDVAAVMNAVGVESAPLIGYSMGGFIALDFAARLGARVPRLVLGGVGESYLRGPQILSEGLRGIIADALLAADKQSIVNPRARMFRDFADQPGKDRFALAACMRAMSPLPIGTLARLPQPILVVCGDRDDVAGVPGPLAAALPGGIAVTISGRDHMSTVGDPRTFQAALRFLGN